MIPVYPYSLSEVQKYSKFKMQYKKKKQELKALQDKKLKKTKAQKNLKREEALKDQMACFRNCVVEKDPKAIKRNAMHQDELDGFVTGTEFDELKRHYNDFNFADLVLEFFNPDQTPPVKKLTMNKPVTFSEAEKAFDEYLTVMGGDGYSKAQLKNEREAFLYSFLLLDDYDAQKEKDKQKQREKEAQEEKAAKGKKAGGMEALNQIKKAKEAIKDQAKDKDDDKKKKEEKKEDEEDEEGDKNIQLKNKQSGQDTKYNELVQLIKKIQQQREEEKNEDLQFAGGDEEEDQFDIADNEKVLKLLLSLKLSDTQQFKQVKKSYAQGGFLKLKKYPDQTSEWICTNSRPKDFCTLVRNAIMTKLTKQANLHTRQFLKKDGSTILMCIKSSETVIKKEAEDSGLTKQLELGYADLFSLEPVDRLYRPLRLKNEVRKAVKQVLAHKGADKFNFEKDIDKPQPASKNIENNLEQAFLGVTKMDENDLWVNIARKQIEVDDWMEQLAENLKIDTSHEKTAIISDDPNTTRNEWNAYFIYLCYLCDYSKRVKRLLRVGKNDQNDKAKRGGSTNIIEMNEGFLYKLIFRKALGDSNEIYKKTNGIFASSSILKSLWQRLGLKDPVSPFTDYFQTNNNEQENKIWRQYEVNERGYRSVFLNMEKIKLSNSVLLKQINISRLKKQQMILAFFPIHDNYQLKGEKKDSYFQSLKEYDLIKEEKETESEIQLRLMFQNMEDEAESTDFDSESVKEETKFNKYIPWHIPEATIRDYFGEKIAIYFRFLSFYTFHLSYMAILGLAMQLIQGLAAQEYQDAFNITFAVIIIVWSTMYIEIWKREQVMFSMRFGQQDFEEDEAERPSFEGTYRRNITNDDLNEEFYPPFRRKLKMLFSVFVSISIIVAVIAVVILIFQFKVQLLNENYPFLQNPIINANTVPAILNALQIVIFNVIYDLLGEILNNYENHKILSSYENSLIAKIFLFQFFNLFNSCVFIAFLSPIFPELKLCEYEPGKQDCFIQLRIQIMIIFLVNFAKNIPELAKPIIMNIVKLYLANQQSSEGLKPINHPFRKIDDFIEQQSFLEPYMTNEEVDGTVLDYMELVIQFSFLALFGLSFPTSFVLAFLNNIAEIQVDKLKLMEFSMRPMPAGSSNIGTWLLILDVITFCSIFSNSGLIAYTSRSSQVETTDGEVINQEDDRIILFSSLLIVFLATKYFFRFIIPDTPEIALILNKRHKVAVDTVVRGFQKSKSKIYKTSKINFNIGGIIYDEQTQLNNNNNNNNNNASTNKQQDLHNSSIQNSQLY